MFRLRSSETIFKHIISMLILLSVDIFIYLLLNCKTINVRLTWLVSEHGSLSFSHILCDSMKEFPMILFWNQTSAWIEPLSTNSAIILFWNHCLWCSATTFWTRFLQLRIYVRVKCFNFYLRIWMRSKCINNIVTAWFIRMISLLNMAIQILEALSLKDVRVYAR